MARKQNRRLHTFFDSLQTRRLRGIRSQHANGNILLVEQNALGPLYRVVLSNLSEDNPSKLAPAFKQAMTKLATNGQDIGSLVDCSPVVPEPRVWSGPATLPKGSTMADLEHPVSA